MIQGLVHDIVSNSQNKTNFNQMLKNLISCLYEINKNELLKNEEYLNEKIKNNFENASAIFPKLTFEQYQQQTIDNLIKNDVNTTLLYVKSPTKQNIFEPLQLAILETFFKIKIQRCNKTKFKGTKTFDGICENKIFQCKYINESGGSQDNQFNDLIGFNVEQNEYINYLVISGDYGIKKMKSWLSNNKLKQRTNVVILDDDVQILTNDDYETQVRKSFNKYYSTNEELIYGLNEINESIIVEPFAGNCDLILQTSKLFKNKPLIKAYDITEIKVMNESKQFTVQYNSNTDTLLNNIFENEENCFVLTNPPYTAKNKLNNETKTKYLHLLTNINDLYQIFIEQLIKCKDKINGGFIIIPTNFLFGKQSQSLRNKFLSVFNIQVLNIFEKQVFDYTTQSVISMLFMKHEPNERCVYIHNKQGIEEIEYTLLKDIINYSMNDEYKHENNKIQVCRNYKTTKGYVPSNIKISCIDPNMKAYIEKYDGVEDKMTDRAYMRLCFTKQFDRDEEESICDIFNHELKQIRERTHSLVLTSFREYDRKRLTFDEVFIIINYIINEEL